MNNTPQSPPNGGLGGDAINPNPQNNLTEKETTLQTYCEYIDNLVNFGLFTKDMGETMKQNLMKYETNEFKKPKGLMNTDASGPNEAETDYFALFLADNPDFFEDRGNLKKYLESLGMKPDKDDLDDIAQLVRELENAAVQRFSANSTHGEMLKEFNELAKNRLKTLSSSVSGGKSEVSKTFTPEQISSMSSDEFKANEKAINELLRSGRL